jgi:hypothetical protein
MTKHFATIAVASASVLFGQTSGGLQVTGTLIPGGPGYTPPVADSQPRVQQVTGKPYSALAVSERAPQRSSSMRYRDSQGRDRREEVLSNGQTAIYITDPVAGFRYVLMPASRTATRTALASPAINPVDSGSSGRVTISIEGLPMKDASPIEIPALPGQRTVTAMPGAQMEDLGVKTIEGLQAEGKRVTTPIPGGQSTVSETWYSPELQVNLVVKTSDPGTGESSYRLTNIKRAEPPASVFQVPAGYTVLPAPARGGQ